MDHLRRDHLLFDAETILRVVHGELRVLDGAHADDRGLLSGPVARDASRVEAILHARAMARHEAGVPGSLPGTPASPSSV